MNLKGKLASLALIIMILGILPMSAETKTAQFTRSFSKIEVYGGANVFYNVSNVSKPYMRISGPSDKIKNLYFSVDGGKLKIGRKKTKYNNFENNILRGVTINVYAPAVYDMEVSSGANLTFNSSLSVPSKDIDVEVSSGARVKLLTVNCRELDLEASSAGTLNVSGVKTQSLSIESSSAAKVVCNSINTEKISCDASSAASITITGNAKYGEFDASSAGKIQAINFRCNKTTDSSSSTGGSIRFK